MYTHDDSISVFRGPSQFSVEDYLKPESLKELNVATPADCAAAPPHHIHLTKALNDGGVYSVTDDRNVSVPLKEEDRTNVLKQKRVLFKKCQKLCGKKNAQKTFQLMAQTYRCLIPMREAQRQVSNCNRQISSIRRYIKVVEQKWKEEEKEKELQKLQSKLSAVTCQKEEIYVPNKNHKRMVTMALQEAMGQLGFSKDFPADWAEDDLTSEAGENEDDDSSSEDEDGESGSDTDTELSDE
jgi:hypothetical protein